MIYYDKIKKIKVMIIQIKVLYQNNFNFDFYLHFYHIVLKKSHSYYSNRLPLFK